MVAEKSFSWGSTTQKSYLYYQQAATLIVAVIGQVKTQSGMHSPSKVRGANSCVEGLMHLTECSRRQRFCSIADAWKLPCTILQRCLKSIMIIATLYL